MLEDRLMLIDFETLSCFLFGALAGSYAYASESTKLNVAFRIEDIRCGADYEMEGLCLKSQESLSIDVSTTCGSGWVNRRIQNSLAISHAHR